MKSSSSPSHLENYSTHFWIVLFVCFHRQTLAGSRSKDHQISATFGEIAPRHCPAGRGDARSFARGPGQSGILSDGHQCGMTSSFFFSSSSFYSRSTNYIIIIFSFERRLLNVKNERAITGGQRTWNCFPTVAARLLGAQSQRQRFSQLEHHAAAIRRRVDEPSVTQGKT